MCPGCELKGLFCGGVVSLMWTSTSTLTFYHSVLKCSHCVILYCQVLSTSIIWILRFLRIANSDLNLLSVFDKKSQVLSCESFSTCCLSGYFRVRYIWINIFCLKPQPPHHWEYVGLQNRCNHEHHNIYNIPTWTHFKCKLVLTDVALPRLDVYEFADNVGTLANANTNCRYKVID